MNIATLNPGHGSIARSILDGLPEWFGIPEAVDDYVRHADEHPLIIARASDKIPIGFLSLKPQTQATTEIYVMGVLRAHHGSGIGRALIAEAMAREKRRGIQYLSVKTLAPTHPDPWYAKTRGFYRTQGFVDVEVFPTLWDEDNPCIFMIKPLA